MAPRVSVIVRSFNRLGVLAELLECLLDQDHDSFEVVIVDQSVRAKPGERDRIEELSRDPRVKFLRYAPLGGPRARNTGVRASRGEIIVLIDDDDLPATRDWLRRHEANYADPRCLGVSGRHLDEHGAPKRYANMEKARRHVLSFNVFKWQRVYVASDRRTEVESLHGTNSSIRRSALARFGLWDECTPIEDEPSIAFRIMEAKRDDEYLVFDPESTIRRRLDVPGGMAKRTLGGFGYARKTFTFLHNIVGYYFPVRFALAYPLYYFYAAWMTSDWILSDSIRHKSFLGRALPIAGVWLGLPIYWTGWLARWWYERLRDGELPHDPKLDEPRARATLPAAVPIVEA
jgi:glycosyltransferase involved in cell wall biosynthesis